MSNGFWSQADAYFFRLLGLFLGFSGCSALLINNPPSQVFTNPYGIVFFFLFSSLAIYSVLAIIWDILKIKSGKQR
ncbi:hypothetical protein MNBD_NITROSPINAE02-665 [hydrothermal vent metagenome]|uniref:Uncharacterized protein n=1 Tax=hydrothermal vent metagenome TaxID=652676 RepID=A0A3B1CRK5_9ZZZZ